jgi:hypothetical protein
MGRRVRLVSLGRGRGRGGGLALAAVGRGLAGGLRVVVGRLGDEAVHLGVGGGLVGALQRARAVLVVDDGGVDEEAEEGETVLGVSGGGLLGLFVG